ncbi:MAG: LPXTG cell wall anchor domain-containing protein [Nitrosomonas sp.]|nr:LPXTG cell wall anchor domain-containing protein [Nitrosomonas sp.]
MQSWITNKLQWLMAVLILVTCSTQVNAHGGLSLAEDMCKLTIGPYTMHFTGYQPESSQEQEFCEDIPNVGRTIVALDYIDEALRPMTTEVRIIRDTGSEDDLDGITVFRVEPKVYSNGSVTFEHSFPAEGKFVGLVTVRENDTEYVSRFPFAVGTGGKSNLPMILGLLVIAAAAGFFFLKKNKPSDSQQAA